MLKTVRWIVFVVLCFITMILVIADADWIDFFIVVIAAYIIIPIDSKMKEKISADKTKNSDKSENIGTSEKSMEGFLTSTYRMITDDELCKIEAQEQYITSLKYHLPLAREAHDMGDYDTARFYYQKTGFANHQTTEHSELYDAVLNEQKNFSQDDPTYQRIIEETRILLLEQENIKQTELYKLMPEQKEDIQYALYFADKNGDLVREKKGRTYLISQEQE